MSKNTAKQLYTQTLEWLKTKGIKISNTNRKRSKFNKYNKKN